MSQRLILFVEGETEGYVIADFFRAWLNPQFDKEVGVKVSRFTGWADYESGIKKKALLYLDPKKNPDAKEIIAVIGLIDLYGPTFYPNKLSTVEERYQFGRGYFEDKVGHDRFRQHFAVHETEAWLLSDPSIFPTEVSKAIRNKVKKPETVNFDKPPAKYLDEIYWRELKRGYKKTTNARNLFPHLNPETVYDKCEYFARMMNDIRDLVTAARA